ncbi:glycosyltransferase family 9 protein [Vibrio mangrovi]|uniref:Glycosyltransferase family 9 protein n=1 Tax=Vibrio mangrovi TaxID=474394 RepID=A0A1Y6IV60_9VIBR|nr:glycosyltransferase family 9 protein [Vibrio mangrovi]MDW6002212.1 glycosyltransferase family 9 protein [Vibrio mangrovi]SMS01557.1 Lipopolysaccharide core heptosyltransferase RfaQ [Vibrio mangrovi]
MALFDSAPRSICVLRLSAIGDVCNAIAAVQTIQRQWPQTKITWITGKLEAQLIHDLENINVIIFDKKQGLKAYRQLWTTLKGEQFDALLHMQYAFRASIATLGIKATYKLGFDATRSQDFQTWFTNQHVPSPNAPHVLDGMLAFAQFLGIKDTTPKWALTYSDSDNQWAEEKLNVHKRNLVIVPGASKAYKNWMAEGYAAVIQYVYDKGWNIILAGSPAQVETDLAARILKLIDCPVTNLVGNSTLKQMLALLDKSDLVIAPDTGPAHMANAMNTPVIGLYAHHNPQRTGPYSYREYVVSAYEDAIKAETGKEISELNWRSRVKDESAMNRIQAAQVTQMFDKAVKDFHLSDKVSSNTI